MEYIVLTYDEFNNIMQMYDGDIDSLKLVLGIVQNNDIMLRYKEWNSPIFSWKHQNVPSYYLIKSMKEWFNYKITSSYGSETLF